MQKNTKVATVFGGTGFIGTQIVRELAKKGFIVKVASRVPERAYFLRPCGTVGQVVPFACDYSEDGITRAVKGADYVVNCTGILFEHGKSKFSRVHTDIPAMIAKACKKEKAARFVHISALGCSGAKSKYARSKLEGEELVRKNFADATVLRPSVVFGPGDSFFNRFAEMARYLPALPLIGGGHTKFQPVYVGDVADAVMAALSLSGTGAEDPRGKIFELGGPEELSFKEIYQRLLHETGRKRILMNLPWGIAKIKGAFLSLLPHPPLTKDQVDTLKTDSIVSGGEGTLEDLRIKPTGMSLILPSYLQQYRPGGRFAAQDDKKRA